MRFIIVFQLDYKVFLSRRVCLYSFILSDVFSQCTYWHSAKPLDQNQHMSNGRKEVLTWQAFLCVLDVFANAIWCEGWNWRHGISGWRNTLLSLALGDSFFPLDNGTSISIQMAHILIAPQLSAFTSAHNHIPYSALPNPSPAWTVLNFDPFGSISKS